MSMATAARDRVNMLLTWGVPASRWTDRDIEALLGVQGQLADQATALVEAGTEAAGDARGLELAVELVTAMLRQVEARAARLRPARNAAA